MPLRLSMLKMSQRDRSADSLRKMSHGDRSSDSKVANALKYSTNLLNYYYILGYYYIEILPWTFVGGR